MDTAVMKELIDCTNEGIYDELSRPPGEHHNDYALGTIMVALRRIMKKLDMVK